jgi:hypothetical protein
MMVLYFIPHVLPYRFLRIWLFGLSLVGTWVSCQTPDPDAVFIEQYLKLVQAQEWNNAKACFNARMHDTNSPAFDTAFQRTHKMLGRLQNWEVRSIVKNEMSVQGEPSVVYVYSVLSTYASEADVVEVFNAVQNKATGQTTLYNWRIERSNLVQEDPFNTYRNDYLRTD